MALRSLAKCVPRRYWRVLVTEYIIEEHFRRYLKCGAYVVQCGYDEMKR